MVDISSCIAYYIGSMHNYKMKIAFVCRYVWLANNNTYTGISTLDIINTCIGLDMSNVYARIIENFSSCADMQARKQTSNEAPFPDFCCLP